MATKITRETLRAMATLAGFPISDARLAELVPEIEWMIDTIRLLDEIDEEGLEPVTIAVTEKV
jgi:Asp-tRNA(Asn)/Glu-tRNA(Gln) amidotransferase C subunit